jgi:hypothetical protein
MLMRYVTKHLKDSTIKAKVIIVENECLLEKDLIDVCVDDFIIWTPITASQNLVHVTNFYNSVVVLENTTTYIRKLSDTNPINENLSLNHNFKIMYLREYDDITNDEYKLIIEPQIIKFDEIIKQIQNVK